MSSAPPATFKPTLIIHGGAGNIHRQSLPPDLYAKYHSSLLSYLRSTHELLKNGATALDAAVHAVSLLEDDELFNCGRGSVFTSAGTIEMEASVMVTSVFADPSGADDARSGNQQGGSMKRGVGVMGIRNVRHPIQLARECLLRTGYDTEGHPNGDGGNMHAQITGPSLEKLAREWNLEFQPDEWFWTERRWEEHRRGLRGEKETITMSQGTVGCVCLDQWGNLAVATSTGGLTNKIPGRVGDTPTLGSGFWAESWDVSFNTDTKYTNAQSTGMMYRRSSPDGADDAYYSTTSGLLQEARALFADCLPSFARDAPPPYAPLHSSDIPGEKTQHLAYDSPQPSTIRRRAVALSGTGNGDSFLRIAAARTASAMLRFSSPTSPPRTLAEAVTAIAGPGGELQRSAGRRWLKTGEGQGGIIGIEAEAGAEELSPKPNSACRASKELRRGKVVFDFNCGGLWRAWMEEGPDGKESKRVMVFREEYR